MPRLLGLAQASKVYRALDVDNGFSRKGQEVAWGTIGNASTSEGPFWEAINAAGVMQVPLVACVWDDEYGISVHAKHQTIKENISTALSGFQRDIQAEGADSKGFEIIKAKGWDYPGLVAAFEQASVVAREDHVPVLLHVNEMTQPMGHSTSGSHERYKSKDRLAWELEYDCISQFRSFILANQLADETTLDQLANDADKEAKSAMKSAYAAYLEPLQLIRDQAADWLDVLGQEAKATSLRADHSAMWRDAITPLRNAINAKEAMGQDAGMAKVWVAGQMQHGFQVYGDHLYSGDALKVPHVPAEYAENGKSVDGRLVLRDNFKAMFNRHPEAMVFGEDSGAIGDVNQGLEGMQEAFGETRVSDTGIREITIMGQGIGLAMRGLRPIAEIQYLDYLLYGMQILSDDCATVRWRTAGGQQCPLIVRTRGHRLEGVWHSGSPMGMILGALRGMIICTPRNMTQAAGMYNTLMQANEPALVIECLNGYRLKEAMPINLGEFTVPLGQSEILREGEDVTILTYGSMCRMVMEAAKQLSDLDMEVEVVDAQTLMPFDTNGLASASLAKTNRLLIVDEDVEGGASAFLLKRVLEDQGGFRHLDLAPRTLTAKAHRPAYGSDGDYFSKPSVEDVVEAVIEMLQG